MKFSTPHPYFFVAALIIFIGCLFLYNSEEAIDINIHDTYFVIASSFYLFALISILLSFIGLIYYLHFKFKVELIKILSQIHTTITIGSIAAYFIGTFIHSKLESKNEFPWFDDSNNYAWFIIIITLLGMTAQLLFIANSLASTFNYFFRKTKKL